MALTQTAATPPRVLALYDGPFWDYLKNEGRMRLQCCRACGTWRYPPGPACPACLSPEADWKPVSGEGELLTWARFHKQYLPAYPAPYTVIAVRLDEGPTMISNLVADPPEDKIVGRRVRLKVAEMDDGVALPRFELVG